MAADEDVATGGAAPSPGGANPVATGPTGAPPERRSGFVDHDGERLYFEVVGEGGVPLVLSHGAGGNHAVWYQQVTPFARDRMVVTWDHRGFGRSTDRSGRSGPEVAAADLLAVLDEIGVARADLVGQSMGGWTVVGAALARPGLARTLVLADTLGGFTSESIVAGLAGRPPTAGRPTAGRPPAGRPPAAELLGRHPALGDRFCEQHPEQAHLYQCLGRMGSADPAVILPRLVASARDASEAARLTMPVLCLVGDEDPLFPPPSVRALADALPDARVVEIAGCGHSPYFEAPQAWNATLREFLASVA